jgi:hypothetical protein
MISVSSVKISDLPQMEEESLVLALQLETDSGTVCLANDLKIVCREKKNFVSHDCCGLASGEMG